MVSNYSNTMPEVVRLDLIAQLGRCQTYAAARALLAHIAQVAPPADLIELAADRCTSLALAEHGARVVAGRTKVAS